MKLLLDSCVSSAARKALEELGHDVAAVADWRSDPGDDEILGRAHVEGRVLVTIDKDFGELAVVHGVPHSGIVRLVDLRSTDQGPICARALLRHGEEIAKGAIVTVEAGRVRVRPGPASGE